MSDEVLKISKTCLPFITNGSYVDIVQSKWLTNAPSHLTMYRSCLGDVSQLFKLSMQGRHPYE